MKGMSDLTLVWRSLRARQLSSCVTVAMVMVAVALLLVLLSLREGAAQAFRRGTGNIHLLVSADASPLVGVLNGLFYANAPANPIAWTKFEEIQESFPWKWAIPTQLGDSYLGSPVMATESEFLEEFEPVVGKPFRFAAGRVFAADFEVVVGAQAASEHGLTLGTKLVMSHGAGASHGGHEHGAHPYEVVGVLEPTGSAHDRALFTNLQSTWIIHAEDRREAGTGQDASAAADHDGEAHDHAHVDAQDLTDADKLITGILLRLPTRPGSDASASLSSQLDRLRRDTSINVAQPAQQIGRLMAIVGDIDWLFVAMAAVVLLSSSVSIMLAMVASMELRRRQVAILRVLGASASRVFLLAITESTLIGAMGALLGATLAVVGCEVASSLLAERIGLRISGTIDLRSAVLVIAGAVVLAAIAGVIPAVKSYRTPVARHLRPLA